MAYIVVMGSFPAHVGMEVGKKFTQHEKLPEEKSIARVEI